MTTGSILKWIQRLSSPGADPVRALLCLSGRPFFFQCLRLAGFLWITTDSSQIPQQKYLKPSLALPPLVQQVPTKREVNHKTNFSIIISVNHTLGKVVIVKKLGVKNTINYSRPPPFFPKEQKHLYDHFLSKALAEWFFFLLCSVFVEHIREHPITSFNNKAEALPGHSLFTG